MRPFLRLSGFSLVAAASMGALHAEIFVADGDYARDTAFALGTRENPYASFNTAGAAAVAAGDSVRILAGNYAGQNITVSGTAGNTLVFNADAGAVVRNDGSLTAGDIKATAVSITGSYLRLDGLQVVGNARNADITPAAALQNVYVKESKFSTTGIAVSARNVTVANCVIRDATASGLRLDGKDGTTVTDYVTFSGNIVLDCGRYTPVGSGAGIVVAAAKPADTAVGAKIQITGNFIRGCQGRVISNVDTKNFATLTLDEGQGIMLTRMDPYTSGSVLVENNVLMYSGSKAISSQFGQGTVVKNNTAYMDGLTGGADPTPVLINKTLNATVSDNLLVTYARNNGVLLMGTTAEQATVSVSGNQIVGEGTALLAGAPGSMEKAAGVTVGAANATVLALESRVAALGVNLAAPVPVSQYLSTTEFHQQQIAYMLLNGTTKRTVGGVDYTAIRLSREDPKGTRQYVSNLAGTPDAETLGLVRPDPASGAAVNFNNRTTVFTQWEDNDTDGASPLAAHLQNGFRLTTNNRLQTYFVDGAKLAALGGDGSDYLMLQREAHTLTLTAETAGGQFNFTGVSLGASAGQSGTIRVTGRRAGALIATADLVYGDSMQTYSQGGVWTALDELTFERLTGRATDASGIILGTGEDYRTYFDNIAVTAIPEPGAYGLMGACAGVAVAMLRARRRTRAAA